VSYVAVVQDTPKKFPLVKEMAAWVFAALTERKHGELVTYPMLSAVLTIDAQSARGRTAVLRAGRRLLVEQNKHLVNVPRIGYTIAQPNEHTAISKRYQHAARRRLVRGMAAVVHVALEALTPEERALVIMEQVRMGLKLGLDRKLNRVKTLPSQPQVSIPSGKELVRLLTKKGE